MKRYVFILSLFLSFSEVLTQNNPIDVGGELMIDERFQYGSNNKWVWNENRITLNLERKSEGKGKFFSRIWIRNLGTPYVPNLSMLTKKENTDPSFFEIREAYAEFYDFVVKDLDLKIGKQRIAWGTADKLNPTDNLNPYDLEDILDFGRHKGSWALNLKYYFSETFDVQGVYLPFFRSANLPFEPYDTIFFSNVNITRSIFGHKINSVTDTLRIPENNLLKNSIYGIKFKNNILNYDFSVSYVYGYNNLPLNTLNYLSFNLDQSISIQAVFSYHRNHIVGFDLAGNVGPIGIWAEAAMFLPEKDITLKNYFKNNDNLINDSVLLKKEPYFKYILGCDYTFADGTYLNFQYLHGFINEYGRKNLNNYLLIRLEKKLFDDKITVSPINGAFIVSDWKNLKNTYTLIYMPEFKYHITADTEISLSSAIFDGTGKSIFAALKKYDLFSFKLKYSF